MKSAIFADYLVWRQSPATEVCQLYLYIIRLPRQRETCSKFHYELTHYAYYIYIHIPAVGGADSSKGLSFTVNLADSLEEKSLKADLPETGDKLSNFLPENLRKSFRERRERRSQIGERGSLEVGVLLEMGDIKILMSMRSRYAKPRYINISRYL